MKTLTSRLELLKDKLNAGKKTRIMIIGLGSVGTYLLDYILSRNDDSLEVVVVGRNYNKMESDVNIIRIAALLRKQNKTKVTIDANCDLEEVASIQCCIARHNADFIVNSSRVYAGLKYGSISWHNLRAYGIWSPLAIKYIRNIMLAHDAADSNAIVINTSYSDAVIPWLRSAGKPYPDFGSGNFNHLVPRIKFAVADILKIEDFWNVEVSFATAHFHDVVISKEGHSEEMEQLLLVRYNGKIFDIPQGDIFERCKIAMPVDSKRNMMNASSNYDIIFSLLDSLRNRTIGYFNSPGAFGEIGGYPVKIDATGPQVIIGINEMDFSAEQMRDYNKRSLYYDGVEAIENGSLFYTDELLQKVKNVFSVNLTKKIVFDKIDETAQFIIENIIKKEI